MAPIARIPSLVRLVLGVLCAAAGVVLTFRPFSSLAVLLMHRMGHGSMRAALIYQHATSERDREIAAALDLRIGREAGSGP